jgi:hypothetical protein
MRLIWVKRQSRRDTVASLNKYEPSAGHRSAKNNQAILTFLTLYCHDFPFHNASSPLASVWRRPPACDPIFHAGVAARTQWFSTLPDTLSRAYEIFLLPSNQSFPYIPR